MPLPIGLEGLGSWGGIRTHVCPRYERGLAPTPVTQLSIYFYPSMPPLDVHFRIWCAARESNSVQPGGSRSCRQKTPAAQIWCRVMESNHHSTMATGLQPASLANDGPCNFNGTDLPESEPSALPSPSPTSFAVPRSRRNRLPAKLRGVFPFQLTRRQTTPSSSPALTGLGGWI